MTIVLIQHLLNMIPVPGEILQQDGDWGPKSERMAAKARAWAGLEKRSGPLKNHEVERVGDLAHGIEGARIIHPRLGRVPSWGKRSYRVTYFGGPDDTGDRLYCSNLITDPGRPDRFPAELYEVGLLRSECREIKKYPVMRSKRWDRNAPNGLYRWVKRPVAGSWCLNPDSWYIALRFNRKGSNTPGRDLKYEKILVRHRGKTVCVALVDYGPGGAHADVDLSPGAFRFLGLNGMNNQDAKIDLAWADASTPLGPVE